MKYVTLSPDENRPKMTIDYPTLTHQSQRNSFKQFFFYFSYIDDFPFGCSFYFIYKLKIFFLRMAKILGAGWLVGSVHGSGTVNGKTANLVRQGIVYVSQGRLARTCDRE